MRRREYGPAAIEDLVLGRGGAGAVALRMPRADVLESAVDYQTVGLRDDRSWILWPSPSAARSARSGWPWLQRLVGLSSLGWTFVAAAVLWEFFALVFSQHAGWGWDKGAFFFAWGLGLLVVGFVLPKRRNRPAVSRIFLVMNALVLGVLSLVVATG